MFEQKSLCCISWSALLAEQKERLQICQVVIYKCFLYPIWMVNRGSGPTVKENSESLILWKFQAWLYKYIYKTQFQVLTLQYTQLTILFYTDLSIVKDKIIINLYSKSIVAFPQHKSQIHSIFHKFWFHSGILLVVHCHLPPGRVSSDRDTNLDILQLYRCTLHSVLEYFYMALAPLKSQFDLVMPTQVYQDLLGLNFLFKDNNNSLSEYPTSMGL